MKPVVITLALVITLLLALCVFAIRSGSGPKNGEFYEIPLFPGATNVVRRSQSDGGFGEEFITFSTTERAERVVSFYAERLPSLGWRNAGAASESNTMIFIRNDCPFYSFYVAIIGEDPVTSVELRQGFELCR